MLNSIRDLLDKTYELEGLLTLVIKRESASSDFIRLINKKGDEIAEILKKISQDPSNENNSNKEVSEFAFNLSEYSIDDDSAESIKESDISDLKVDYRNEVEDKEISHFNQRGKLVFSINDRFRFRKELFNNSDADFNNTLALVASMEDYEEAEDFFINEEGFERNNPAVADFLFIIKKYFK